MQAEHHESYTCTNLGMSAVIRVHV